MGLALALAAEAEEKRLAAEAGSIPDEDVAKHPEVVAARKAIEEKRLAREEAEKTHDYSHMGAVPEQINALKAEVALRQDNLALLCMGVLLAGDLKMTRAVEEQAQLDRLSWRIKALELGVERFNRHQGSLYATLRSAVNAHEAAVAHLATATRAAKIQLLKDRQAKAPKVFAKR